MTTKEDKWWEKKPGLSKSSGNMYPPELVTATWNPIGEICPHGCEYCFMKAFRRQAKWRCPEPRIHDDIGTDLSNEKRIFVCSGTDLFGRWVPDQWIARILRHCRQQEKEGHDEWYLFQTKDPAQFLRWPGDFPERSYLATTIETDREDLSREISEAPGPHARSFSMRLLSREWDMFGLGSVITVEPILEFDDVEQFAWLIAHSLPDRIVIGADSKKHKLREPSAEKIEALVEAIVRQSVDTVRFIFKRELSRLVDVDRLREIVGQ